MCLRFRSVWVAPLIGALFSVIPATYADEESLSAHELRVCADPNNFPYSDQRQAGFENAIAQLIADDLHRDLKYFWMPQFRGFVRKTAGEGLCDVFIGVPADFERVSTTRPYYRSTYVFVTRTKDGAITNFSAPRLRTQRVGVQLIGDDLAATPPGYALARIGAIDNVVGYTFYADTPVAQRMVNDLIAGRIDVAVIWGPQAGYFAQHATIPLTVSVAHAPRDLSMPFEFAIAIGVKHGDRQLQHELNEALDRLQPRIDTVLARYSVPRVDRDNPITASRAP